MTDIAASTRLEQLEAIVDLGLETFVDVGRALAEIRDRKLFLERGAADFKEYVTQRWEPRLSLPRAYQLIDAAKSVEAVSNMLETPPPANARQAAELAPLVREDPEAAAQVWQTVRQEKGESVTARDVRDAVRQHQGKPPVRRANDLDVFQPDPDDIWPHEPTITRAALRASVIADVPGWVPPAGWQNYEVLEARTRLSNLPDATRPTAMRMIAESGVPPDDGLKILRNLEAMPSSEQAEVVRLYASNDGRDRSLAKTTAAGTPPMPDPRVAVIRDCERRLGEIIRRYPDDEYANLIGVICNHLEAVRDAIAAAHKEKAKCS